jgi:hypothetical protein
MKNRFFQILPIAVVFALIFAGCSSDGDDGEPLDTGEETFDFTLAEVLATIGDDYAEAYTVPQITLDDGSGMQPYLYVGADGDVDSDILLLYASDPNNPGGEGFFSMTFQSGDRTAENPFLGTWKWEDSARGYYMTLTFTSADYTLKYVMPVSYDYNPPHIIGGMAVLEMVEGNEEVFEVYTTWGAFLDASYEKGNFSDNYAEFKAALFSDSDGTVDEAVYTSPFCVTEIAESTPIATNSMIYYRIP